MNRGRRAGNFNSVHGASELLLVFALESFDAFTSLELSAEDFVSLAESVKLASEVLVLSLENGSVLVKSTEFTGQLNVNVGSLTVETTSSIDILTGNEESVFTFLELDISVFDLTGQVGVTAVLEVNVFAEVVVLSTGVFVVTAEVAVLAVKFGVQVADTGEFTLTVLESNCLGAEVSTADIN